MNAAAEGKDEDALRLELNRFADLMPEEYPTGHNYSGDDDRQGQRRLVDEEFSPRLLSHKAVTVDHHILGHTVPVKDQGNCGSCWAFVANSALESAIAIKYNTKPVHLSEQYLVDCDTRGYNAGCNGGLESAAWEFTKKNGARYESDYPYKGKD